MQTHRVGTLGADRILYPCLERTAPTEGRAHLPHMRNENSVDGHVEMQEVQFRVLRILLCQMQGLPRRAFVHQLPSLRRFNSKSPHCVVVEERTTWVACAIHDPFVKQPRRVSGCGNPISGYWRRSQR